jgi:uncharacterized membrane protein YccC
MTLSTRVKEAIKTALAMTIAFGIALFMDWEKPYWAGFAVAFISLDTFGASFNKAAMRMLGTLVAITAAFTFLALFPQQRWLFMTFVALYVGLCAYMMTGKRHQYFWYASGFICVVIAVNSSNSLSAFQIAIERAQETGTGVLVYSLVSALLWPRGSKGSLEDTTCKLWATQTEIYQHYRSLMSENGSAKDSRPLRLQENQLMTRVGQLLNAAETDSYDVWELRYHWRYFHQLSTRLSETLERWRESLSQNQNLDLENLLPNLSALVMEIEQRFEGIAHMLAGHAPERLPEAVALKIDRAAIGSLDHFQKAAVAVFQTQIDRLEALSRALFDCVRDLKGFSGPALKPLREEAPGPGLSIDPDRLQGAITVMATLWIAFLIWVYVNPPGHASFVMMSTVLVMVAVNGGINPKVLALPLIFCTLFAGSLYIFVMPHLSGYGQLGLMIFVVTFGITYLFSAPHLAIVKLIALAMFANQISVQNQQTYSFAAFANGFAMISLVAAFLIATAYIPVSPRPEKVFLRLLRRFFRQAESLISCLAIDRDRRRGWVVRWKMHFYRSNLLELPPKLARWGARIDHGALPKPDAKQIEEMVNSLAIIADRLKMLMADRQVPMADILVQQLLEDFRAWRLTIQEIFQNWWRSETADIDAADLQTRLASLLNRLEKRIDTLFRRKEGGTLSEEDNENFYRLLGSYRSLSEAVVEHARLVTGLNWEQWREERF